MQRTHILAGLGLAIAALFAPLSAEAQVDRGYQNGGLYGGQRGGQAQLILYSDTNFRGEARVYYGDVETLARDGFNDVARSVEVIGGAWTLCKDRAGAGRCRTIETSVADLGRLGLDCEVTSFYQSGYSDAGYSRGRGGEGGFGRRDRGHRGNRGGGYGQRGQGRRGGRNGPPVTLFTKDDFRGRSIGISGPVNLRDVGFNDKADSILISRGRWIVCTGRDLGGHCDVLARSVYDLDDIDLDDNISSIAPYSRRGNRRNDRRRRY